MAERQLDRSSLGDHIDRLDRAAWAMCGSREEAEDLVQETFLRVMSRPRLLRSEDDLGYLLCALRNTFLSARRTAARRPSGEPFDDRLELIEDLRRESAARGPRGPARSIRRSPRCRSSAADALVAVDVLGLSYPAKRLLVFAGAAGDDHEPAVPGAQAGRRQSSSAFDAPAPARRDSRVAVAVCSQALELDQRAPAQAEKNALTTGRCDLGAAR